MDDDRKDGKDNTQEVSLPPSRVKAIESELISKGLGAPQAQVAVQVFQHLVKSHSGPLPPAEDFAAYDNVFPGAAKEILDMAIRQQLHAHYCEKTAITGELRYRLFGMIAAVAVVLLLVVGAIMSSIYGQTSVAITLGGAAGLTTLAGAFIKGRRLFEPDAPTQKSRPSPNANGAKKRR